MKRVFRSALILCLGCFWLSSNVFAASPRQALVDDGMIVQAMKRGSLRVGLSTFVPWAMPDKNGQLVGFEVDVATRLAKDLGLKLELVPTDWGGIIPALLSGKFDVIIGGMSVSMERGLRVNFSIPYDYSGMDILANRQKAAGFNSPEDFNNPQVVLALRNGASSVTAVKKFMPLAQIRYFDDESQAVQEVLVGRAHAMISSLPLPSFQAIKYPDNLFTPLDKPFTREPIAFAVRKGDADSLNVLDNWIRLASEEGWLEERHHYWFNTTDWEKDLK